MAKTFSTEEKVYDDEFGLIVIGTDKITRVIEFVPRAAEDIKADYAKLAVAATDAEDFAEFIRLGGLSAEDLAAAVQKHHQTPAPLYLASSRSS
jgi:hypothetical protein